MKLLAAVEAMVEAGASAELILAVVRRYETEREVEAMRRREQDAERKRSQRQRESHAASRGHSVTERDSAGPSPRAEAGDARVVVLTSSLRSEGTQEANASFVDAPCAASKPSDPEKPKTKPPKAGRGTRLPDDWEPSDADVILARSEGLTDEEISRAALEFRNYWSSRSRDATRLSWPRTWHNRVIEIADRKRRNGPRLVAEAGQPGGGRRGATSFADLYARRHGAG